MSPRKRRAHRSAAAATAALTVATLAATAPPAAAEDDPVALAVAGEPLSAAQVADIMVGYEGDQPDVFAAALAAGDLATLETMPYASTTTVSQGTLELPGVTLEQAAALVTAAPEVFIPTAATPAPAPTATSDALEDVHNPDGLGPAAAPAGAPLAAAAGVCAVESHTFSFGHETENLLGARMWSARATKGWLDNCNTVQLTSFKISTDVTAVGTTHILRDTVCCIYNRANKYQSIVGARHDSGGYALFCYNSALYIGGGPDCYPYLPGSGDRGDAWRMSIDAYNDDGVCWSFRNTEINEDVIADTSHGPVSCRYV